MSVVSTPPMPAPSGAPTPPAASPRLVAGVPARCTESSAKKRKGFFREKRYQLIRLGRSSTWAIQLRGFSQWLPYWSRYSKPLSGVGFIFAGGAPSASMTVNRNRTPPWFAGHPATTSMNTPRPHCSQWECERRHLTMTSLQKPNSAPPRASPSTGSLTSKREATARLPRSGPAGRGACRRPPTAHTSPSIPGKSLTPFTRPIRWASAICSRDAPAFLNRLSPFGQLIAIILRRGGRLLRPRSLPPFAPSHPGDAFMSHRHSEPSSSARRLAAAMCVHGTPGDRRYAGPAEGARTRRPPTPTSSSSRPGSTTLPRNKPQE